MTTGRINQVVRLTNVSLLSDRESAYFLRQSLSYLARFPSSQRRPLSIYILLIISLIGNLSRNMTPLDTGYPSETRIYQSVRATEWSSSHRIQPEHFASV